jgi:hypothetical protein
MNPKLLPSVMIVLDVLAAAVYACNKNPRLAIYWLAGAVLTASVTF